MKNRRPDRRRMNHDPVRPKPKGSFKKTHTSSVGVVVPCFNQGLFAEDCLASINNQTYSNWRAVLLDDASTDGFSGKICETLATEKVSVTRLNQNLGRSLIRNEGVNRLGPVDFILNVDCDDFLSPNYIEELVIALNNNPDAGLAYGQLHYFGCDTEGKKWPDRQFAPDRMYIENIIPGPGTMIRSRALAQTAMWRGDFTGPGGEDYDIWLQVIEAGWKPIWRREAVYFYRQHNESFLAQSNAGTQVDVALRILRHHKKGITRTVGIESYLEKLIMPELLQTIRMGRFKRASGLLSYLLRISPLSAAKLIVRYYLRRLMKVVSLILKGRSRESS